MRMRAFDDHIPSWVHVNTRGVSRIRLHEPNNNRNVVGNALKRHGNSSIGLEKVDGAAIVVSETRSTRDQRGEGGGESHQVLADQPLGVFRVGKGGGAPLREDGAEELLDYLRIGRRGIGVGRRRYHSIEIEDWEIGEN
ncbi:hypothetical protein E5676_scaffold35G003000 [Cucumis melo var. makuwa]|uniref:Uncharacterized protein n=1 Tax=Cucumis melo var. makuwa TaxID=1194695 RepID=A0A5D3CZB6_CUCMM|nr:hypothetical protein E5676_scaffold35G003000 [Cucumis melo var. makuwa]